MQKSTYQVIAQHLSSDERHIYQADIRRALAISNLFSEFFSDLASLFTGTYNWFAEKIKRNRQRKELYALDDHMLSDIGITRGDIEGIVNGTLDLYRGQAVPANIEFLKQPKTAAVVQEQQDETPIAA
jgi:uncharacterized protein YjiS (DUF1127 family)